MPRVTLTSGDKGSIHRKSPPEGELVLFDTILPGFGLRIGKKASTYFVVTRVRGQPGQIRRRIGTTRDTTLADARKAAGDIIKSAQDGIDRLKVDQTSAGADAKAAASPRAFKAVADAYLDDGLKGGGARLKSRGELERKLKRDLAGWHDRAMGAITKADIRTLVREKAQVSPASANRLLSFIKRVFVWADDQDIIDADPARGIRMPGEERRRDRFLSDAEIRLFWKACDGLGDPAGRLFKLALTTGQRRGEVAGLKRSELGALEYADPKKGATLTADAWLLPQERTKRRHAHAVPLAPLAKRLIDGAPKIEEDGRVLDHIFASGRRGDQPPSGWSRFKEQLDEKIGRLVAKDAGETYDPERHDLPEWHVHDLRATCASHMEMLGIDRRVISRILNHAEGDSQTAAYTRYAFDREAADALRLWAGKLERLCGVNVVSLKSERAG